MLIIEPQIKEWNAKSNGKKKWISKHVGRSINLVIKLWLQILLTIKQNKNNLIGGWKQILIDHNSMGDIWGSRKELKFLRSL